MTCLERRDRLADHETSVDGCGECFIAVHRMDGNVQAISGIIDMMTIEPDHNDHIWTSWNDWIDTNVNGLNVTLHFTSDFVQEVRSMDGSAVRS